MNDTTKPVHSPPLNEVFLLVNPMPFAHRYGQRIHCCVPVFAHVRKWKRIDDDYSVPAGKVDLLDINLDCDIEAVEATSLPYGEGSPGDSCMDIPDTALQLLRLPPHKRPSAGKRLAQLAAVMAQGAPAGPWGRFNRELNAGRFEANVWFERDRKHVMLTDLLDGSTVVSLWDEEVDEAIESGYLAVPRRPRPSDADWLPQLLDYARDTGALACSDANEIAKQAPKNRHRVGATA